MFRYLGSILLLPFLVVGGSLRSQHNDIPLQRDYSDGLEKGASYKGSTVITGLKPVIESRADVSAVQGYKPDSTKYYYDYEEKIFRDHLFEYREGDVRLSLDPLFHFELGHDLGDATPYADTNRYYNNTRGFLVKGDIGKVSFQTMFHESQTVVPQYLHTIVRATGALPGHGRSKLVTPTKMDVGWSQASVSWSPTAWLNLQMGHGRHFVGHGYRSVLLSDNAAGAPYLKFSVMPASGCWQYTSWHSKLQHGLTQADRLPTGQSSESLFQWMRARSNHFAVRVGRVEAGLFETTIFRNIDENGVTPFDALELNPLIGVNTLVAGFGGDYKSLVGMDLKIGLADGVFVYGQFGTDDPANARYAWQAGLHWFDLFVNGLNVRVEHNVAQPYTYMADPEQLAYMHSGLPMAHPLGANFTESVAIVEKSFKERLRVRAKVNLATYAVDTLGRRLNGDLDRPIPDPAPEPPTIKRDLFVLDAELSYLFNPKTNLRAALGVLRRDLPGADDGQQSTYVYIALRTGLFNRYHDL
jgi:hypothetical protein